MSLALIARRAAMTASRRLPSVARSTRFALSTHAYKLDNLGETATHMQDEFAILDEMMEDGFVDRQKAEQLRSLRTYAVDAPDGESDGHLAEEMKEIKAMWEEVAANKEEINARIRELMKVYAVDSPDGETDGHIAEEMEEIKHIIDDAAKVENKNEIEHQHSMEKAVRMERARDPEHDW